MANLKAFYDHWRALFSYPDETKREWLRSPGKGGWYPPYSETPGYTGKKDAKEYFHVRTSHLGLPLMGSETTNVFMECYAEARCWLTRMFSTSTVDALEFTPDNCVLRVLHYLPTADGLVGEKHVDFDLLTVSVPGTVPGMEVMIGGNWVQREDGIQIGEMLEIYTWDNFLESVAATPHRVVTPPMTERYKAVFFYLPPNDFELKPNYTAQQYLKEALSNAGTIDIGRKLHGVD